MCRLLPAQMWRPGRLAQPLRQWLVLRRQRRAPMSRAAPLERLLQQGPMSRLPQRGQREQLWQQGPR